MARDPTRTIYIGNLDEKVTERILYELLIQVGRVVDLHMPIDKETNRHKGYAFAEYESEEIANYAVRLFSGLVSLHNKPLRFSMSGQDKPATPKSTPLTILPRVNANYPASPVSPNPSLGLLPRLHSMKNQHDPMVNVDHFHRRPLTPSYPRGDLSRIPRSNIFVGRPLTSFTAISARGAPNVDSGRFNYSPLTVDPRSVNVDRRAFRHYPVT